VIRGRKGCEIPKKSKRQLNHGPRRGPGEDANRRRNWGGINHWRLARKEGRIRNRKEASSNTLVCR